MAAFPCPHCEADVYGYGVEQPQSCPSCGRDLVVCERYRIRELLGKGDLGLIYGAEREPDGLRVAVKVVSLKDGGGWASMELFEESTRMLQSLRHPGIPKVYAFEQGEEGQLILVREAFDGGTLEERIHTQRRRLEPREFHTLLERLLGIFAYLHELVPPVLHRSLKPANIMFRTVEDWDPVLVDFDTVTSPTHVRTGLTMVGTPGYAAPEQFVGDASPASDLYGLGATLLFVATHREPAELPRGEGGRFNLGEQLEGLEDRTRRVLVKLVEPDAADRYQSARAALADLEEPPPPPPQRRAPPPAAAPADRRSQVGVVLALAVVLVAAAGGLVGYLTLSKGKPPPVQHPRAYVASRATEPPPPAATPAAPAAAPGRTAKTPPRHRTRRATRRRSSRTRASRRRATRKSSTKAPATPKNPRTESSFRREACKGLLSCYDRYQAYGRVSGKVVMEVNTGGAVTSARYTGSATGSVRSCLLSVARRRRLRRFWGGPARLTCEYVGQYAKGAPLISYRRLFRRK